jgi:hypothetical protein
MLASNGMPPGMFESEMIGAIKIKDGLFIGDELASTVSVRVTMRVGPRVRGCKQSDSHYQLCR